MKLIRSAACKFLSGLAATAVLLFLPAGTWHYPGAWLFAALMFLPMLGFGVFLYLKAPELLEKRLNTRETEPGQKIVVLLASLVFAGAFVLAALAFRCGWTVVPVRLRVAAAVVMLVSYGLYMEVMRENAYLSRTVEIQAGQKVIDTGLYGIVRHPMYTATIFLFLSIPLVLGSWLSFGMFALYPGVIVLRIRGEEAALEKGLDGYREYQQKVKYRLIPYIW